MKRISMILLLAAIAGAATAQTAGKPATHAAATTKPDPKTPAAASGIKLPPGMPPGKGIVSTAFALRYQDIKTGTGPEAEPGKMYKIHYTGWLAADGHKFDSSYDHRPPVMDKDGKPVLGDDGKPKLGDPQPLSFPQGYGRLIPGFDQGVAGMKIGGKRRIFIPWQLAYGALGRPGPDAAHPGIPPRADLIFDVELLEVTDLAMPANHPGMTGVPGGRPMPPGMMPRPATAAPASPPAPPADHTAPAPAAPATPQTQPAAPQAQPATPAQPK
jgi:peptidylprolyl isomerase